jgi:Holliday junction resolvasome RuvABC DNA-binding subunit
MENIAFIRAIENKDVQRLTGKKQRTCSRILTEIRKKLGKNENQVLTIGEYARFRGLNEKEICLFLGIYK